MTQHTGLGVREDGSLYEPSHAHAFMDDITSSSLPLHAHWIEEGEEFTSVSLDHKHSLTDEGRARSHVMAVYPESELTDEQTEERRRVEEQIEWDSYWNSLTPEEKAKERALMDAYAAQQRGD